MLPHNIKAQKIKIMHDTKIPNISAKTRDIYLDAVKGFLILCIVLEHNTLLTAEHDWIRPFTDAFAAGCFFIFTFAWQIKKLSPLQFINKYFAHCWPFIVLITATSILNFFMYFDGGLIDFLSHYAKAIFIASPQAIKESSGFMYFWFLPCLCFLYLIRLMASKLGKLSYLFTIPAWLLIGTFDEEILIQTPFSLHVIAFIMLIGQIYSDIHKPLLNKNGNIKFLIMPLFLLCSVASYFIGWELFLAGGNIPSWKQPGLLMFYSLFMLIAIPGIYHISHALPLFFIKPIAYLGDNSLIVYLFHPIIYVIITQIIPIVTNPILSLLVTVIICAIISVTLKKVSIINTLMFPSTLNALAFHRKA